MRTWIAMVVELVAGGCVSPVDVAVRDYLAVAETIQLGQSVDEVLQILEPTQSALSAAKRKQSDRHIRDGEEVFIYYARSRRQVDGLTTDDEFMPYVFVNGMLKAIGWITLGGPKPQGQTTPETHVHVHGTYRTRYW